MGSPLKGKTVLGFDPGYINGCKTAVVDKTGKVLDTAVVYPTTHSKFKTEEAKKIIQKMVKKYNVDVGLICAADGGTKLEQWQVGGLLYENAVSQAKLALRTSTIVGVLWHQGESDCAPELTKTYKERFEVIMNALRKDLGLDDVPFILGELGSFLKDYSEYTQNYVKMNEQLREIASANKLTGIASADGLTANADNLHFNAKSLYEFGLRYFAEFERLSNKNKEITEKEDDSIRSEMELL
jgi:hypothetical protein